MMNIEQLENETAIPGMVPGSGAGPKIDSSTFKYRCMTANLMDLGETSLLEEIMTKSLDGKDIVLVERDKFSFQNNYYVVLIYLERV